jgi:hypothetical protein
MKKRPHVELRSRLNNLLKSIRPTAFGWNSWYADVMDGDDSQLRCWRRGAVLPGGRNWNRFVRALEEMGAQNSEFLRKLEDLKDWISKAREKSARHQKARYRSAMKRQPAQPDKSVNGRQFKKVLTAWSEIDSGLLYGFVAAYYKGKGLPLFAYPCSAARVPLYVRPSWQALTDRSLVMKLNRIERAADLPKSYQEFLTLYADVRKAMGHRELWNGRVFRLTELRSSAGSLSLHFEQGRFFDALACQYILEHEARLALAPWRGGVEVKPRTLPVRDSVASTAKEIEHFCQTQTARIGISNLLLFRSGKNTYRPMIRSRGKLSMGQTGVFDTIGSGVFDIANADAGIDFDRRYKILKELYEELLGGVEVETEISQTEPDFFFRKPGIKELLPMLRDDRASFQITGFCIDLIRAVPEITTVFIVRDSKYFSRYRDIFSANSEYEAGSPFDIPRKLGNVDEYLAERFPSNPAQPDAGMGFDPVKWSLSGAFCFYQGLKRASAEGLL